MGSCISRMRINEEQKLEKNDFINFMFNLLYQFTSTVTDFQALKVTDSEGNNVSPFF
jgi:hypothetical protein